MVSSKQTNNACIDAEIAWFGEGAAGEPTSSARITASPDYVQKLTDAERHDSVFANDVPAQLLETALTWDDLVLAPQASDQVEELVAWVKQEPLIREDWGLSGRLMPGYRSLFSGPPGTGKTLTAALIGKRVGRPVYRVDLSQLVSKYIGETEKNLASVFEQAQNQNWILFFDEADALFGNRTEARTSNDRAANQLVAYLLQRIEEHAGVVILATNLTANIDGAFMRRFQSVIRFAKPDRPAGPWS